MNPALIMALLPLLQPALGALGDLLKNLIENIGDNDIDDQVAVTYEVVKGLAASKEVPEEEKRQRALEAIKLSPTCSKLPDSIINALIELAYQRVRYESVRPAAAE